MGDRLARDLEWENEECRRRRGGAHDVADRLLMVMVGAMRADLSRSRGDSVGSL